MISPFHFSFFLLRSIFPFSFSIHITCFPSRTKYFPPSKHFPPSPSLLGSQKASAVPVGHIWSCFYLSIENWSYIEVEEIWATDRNEGNLGSILVTWAVKVVRPAGHLSGCGGGNGRTAVSRSLCSTHTPSTLSYPKSIYLPPALHSKSDQAIITNFYVWSPS